MCVCSETPDGLFEGDNLRSLRDAIAEFRALSQLDLRAACLQKALNLTPPVCKDIRQANQLIASLAPICGSESMRLAITLDVAKNGEQKIHDIAELLSSAYYFAPEYAKKLVEDFGGEDTLFSLFRAQTPWVTYPTVKQDESLGRTVCADLYLVPEAYQKDIHESIVDMCGMLLAISPTSDAVASAAVDPSGQPIKVGDFHLCLKHIPRKNLPPKARVAWNIALRNTMLSSFGELSLTQYVHTIAVLIVRAEKAFRFFSEKWIKGKNIPCKNTMVDDVNGIIEQVNAIAHVNPLCKRSLVVTAQTNRGAEEVLGVLITTLLGNIIPRMGSVLIDKGFKMLACFAASTARSTREEASSNIWRMTPSPPKKELLFLAQRLEDIASILHELDHDSSPQTFKALRAAAKKGSSGKTIPSAARWCRANAERRLQGKLRSLELSLRAKGWDAHCWTRPLEKGDSDAWPQVDITILVEINDIFSQLGFIADCHLLGRTCLGDSWLFSFAPVINGIVVAELATTSYPGKTITETEFASKWNSHVSLPFLSANMTKAFDEAIAACVNLSTLLHCRDAEYFHPDEKDVFSFFCDEFAHNCGILTAAPTALRGEAFHMAIKHLDKYYSRFQEEWKALEERRETETPLCLSLNSLEIGELNTEALEMMATRLALLQSESRLALETTNYTNSKK